MQLNLFACAFHKCYSWNFQVMPEIYSDIFTSRTVLEQTKKKWPSSSRKTIRKKSKCLQKEPVLFKVSKFKQKIFHIWPWLKRISDWVTGILRQTCFLLQRDPPPFGFSCSKTWQGVEKKKKVFCTLQPRDEEDGAGFFFDQIPAGVAAIGCVPWKRM